jgi:hypothetical protein
MERANFFLNRLRMNKNWAAGKTREKLLRALELGVGVHHGGMRKVYR